MTNKEIVQFILPNAKIEYHTSGFPKERYYLIRNGREYMYLAEGESPSKAWKDALPVVLLIAKKAIEVNQNNNL